jgi:sugar phosphate isomerase/epimerase
MIRIAVSQLSSIRWSFYQDVIRYNALGYNSIGIWRPKLEDCDLLEAIDFLHEMKTEVSSLHWAGGFTGSNGISYQDAIHDAREAIALTGRLNGNCLIIHPGCRNGHTGNHAQRILLQAMEALLPVARDYDVKLALEMMPCETGKNWTFLQCLQSTLDVAEAFPAEQLGFVLDLYHTGLNCEIYENLPLFAHRILLVQLADRHLPVPGTRHQTNERLIPGQGDVPFEKWFEHLHSLGYRGNYELELHGNQIQHIPYRERLTLSSRYLSNLPSFANQQPLPQRARQQLRQPRRNS